MFDPGGSLEYNYSLCKVQVLTETKISCQGICEGHARPATFKLFYSKTSFARFTTYTTRGTQSF